ncbi:type 2 DNA topoisomerase 6 subunit B-like [Cryptomeria japonica]|uniref:type 2 DNA topoisomerase 6 subunit B-like n=1 Tax=Cryptomeria japonica TaxID=3369 RepID=UPI0027DA128D|nr:type 2 DNA topoisomerase 6 subunit B-like [Cryptomeria japonica]
MDNVCRALVSSAIHRCQATDRLCRITIAIKYPGASKSSSSTTFQISISDTGRGINLPEFLLSYSNINLHRANDIFFSSPQCWDGELSIKTTDMEKTEVQHFWLNWGESRVVQVGTSSKGRNTFSGTEASFSVQGNLEEFIVYIKDLCQKIAILQIPRQVYTGSIRWCKGSHEDADCCSGKRQKKKPKFLESEGICHANINIVN